MGKWDYCSKGVILNSTHNNIDISKLEGADFIINDIGSWGTDFDKTAAERLNLASQLKIPAILKMWIDYLPYMGRGYENEAEWPTLPTNEEHMQYLERAIYSGTVKRYYHGILWDMTHNKTVDLLTTFMPGWMVKITKHLMVNGYNRYELPSFAFFSQVLLDSYIATEKVHFTNAFSKLDLFNPMSCKKYTWVTGDIEVSNVESIPYPNDNYSPDYIHSPSWGFWQIANQKFVVKDKEGKSVYLPVVLYNGTKEALYEELNFIANPTIPPIEDEPIGDIKSLLNTINESIQSNNTILNSKLDSIISFIEKLKQIE